MADNTLDVVTWRNTCLDIEVDLNIDYAFRGESRNREWAQSYVCCCKVRERNEKVINRTAQWIHRRIRMVIWRYARSQHRCCAPITMIRMLTCKTEIEKDETWVEYEN